MSQASSSGNMAHVKQEQNQGTQVVHVREGSQNDFDALFDVLKNTPAVKPSPIPMKQRNLPASFFSPRPRQGNHSRESSADSTGYSVVPPGVNHLGTLPRQTAGSLQISHGRSHSSPAGLHQTLSAAPQQTAASHSHLKTASFDLTEERPLPPGWEIATTPRGERYFLNHNDQTTSWEDPRKTLSNNALNQQPTASPPQITLSQTSPPLSSQNLGLPTGWEQATTPEGEIYFINHADKSTSWYDPRIPKHLQKLGLRTLSALQQQHPQHMASILQQQQQQQQQASPPTQHNLPNIQRSPVQNDTQFQSRLQKLQQEKQLLIKRQQEILKQEHELQQHLITTRVSSPPTGTSTSEMQAVSTSGVDPFLGQGTPNELHARQNSADSGLGGMGTSYSLPRTPEDFLGNVDEMETQETGPKVPNLPTDFALDSMPAATSMDVSNLGDASGDNSQGPTGMDSDDLVPSLQEDISNELLNDIDGQKMENLLTWL